MGHPGDRRTSWPTYRYLPRTTAVRGIPAGYYNLIAHPECELHIGPRGGRFVAHEVEGGERDRLFGLAVDLYPGYGNYAQRTDGIRTIRMLRLSPAS